MSGITNGRREILTATVYLVRVEVAILEIIDGVTPCCRYFTIYHDSHFQSLLFRNNNSRRWHHMLSDELKTDKKTAPQLTIRILQ